VKYSNEEMLGELRAFYERVGRAPKKREAQDRLPFGESTVTKRFGSWNKALIAAGVPVSREIKTYIVQCAECGKEISRTATEVKRSKNHFCNHSCSAKFNNRKRQKKIKHCLFCGKVVRNKYCGPACQHAYHRKVYIERWLAGEETGSVGSDDTTDVSDYVRRYLLEQASYQCTQCGWSERNVHTNTIPLEIDHINGDWQNNGPENLRVLCPNCHALTPTHRGANRGSGTARKYCGGRGSYWKNK